MGKYMKKSKITADVAVMELSLSHSQSTTLGVRTRAKTLALQRLHSSSPSPQTPTATATSNLDSSSFSYLQLRSRRLEKPPPPPPTEKVETPQQLASNKKLNSKGSSRLSKMKAVSGDFQKVEEGEARLDKKCEAEDLGIEGSFGENYLEFEFRERSNRESTPSSLIRDADATATPGSTTRKGSSAANNRRIRNDLPIQRNIPTTHEMEEFFACAEQKQQRRFIEKYNFDVVNDLPLPGHYEWVPVFP